MMSGGVNSGRRILGTDATRAVGRFQPDGPAGYRAASMPNAPLRATRGEAEADQEAWLHRTDQDGRQ